MNEKEIDALDGRALDLAIERYVFGNEKPPETDDIDWHKETNDDGTRLGIKYVPDGEMWYHVSWPPEYHSSDWLVFKVVDKLAEINPRMHIRIVKYLENWKVDIYDTYSDGYSDSPLRCLAICRAALKKVLNDQKNN